MSKITSLNPNPDFYDKPDHYDKISYQKRQNSKNEFGLEIQKIVPSEGEVRMLGNRHRDCSYYTMGLNFCKKRILQTNGNSFLPCKEVLDATFRCYTNDSTVGEYHKVQKEAQPYMNNFMNCYFTKETNLTECMLHFENSIRAIYRTPGNKLIDY